MGDAGADGWWLSQRAGAELTHLGLGSARTDKYLPLAGAGVSRRCEPPGHRLAGTGLHAGPDGDVSSLGLGGGT